MAISFCPHNYLLSFSNLERNCWPRINLQHQAHQAASQYWKELADMVDLQIQGLTSQILLFGLAFLIWAVLNHLRQHYARYGRLQGPRIYPVVGHLFELLRNKHRILEWSTEYLAKVPGNTLTLKRLGDKAFKITANPVIVEYILKTNFENYPKGDHISGVLSDLLGDGIFNADDGLWKMQRKIASYEFTSRSLRDYLMDSLGDEVENRLLPTVLGICETGARVDLQDLFMRFAFDNICKLAFGVDPVCLDPSFPAVKFVRAFDDATRLSTQRFYMVHPLLWKAMKALNIGPERKLKEALAGVDEFAVSVIRNRREAVKSKKFDNQDLLSRFMSLQVGDDVHQAKELLDHSLMEKDGQSFSDKFLRDIIISFVLAGRDTTSVSLAWFFWLLSLHPEVERKIIKEIKSIVASRNDNQASSGEEEQQKLRNRKHFSYDELREMHYLHAALSESLRLYPAVPVDTKVARNSDVWPDGTRIEKGMRVSYHVYAMGRLQNLWGEDCLVFRPERWMEDGHFVAESPYKFTAFQAGPRICLGKDMAMLQMKSVAAALILNFEFVIADAGFQPHYSLNMTLPMKDGLPVLPRLRTVWT